MGSAQVHLQLDLVTTHADDVAWIVEHGNIALLGSNKGMQADIGVSLQQSLAAKDCCCMHNFAQ